MAHAFKQGEVTSRACAHLGNGFEHNTEQLSRRVARAKAAYTTRLVRLDDAVSLVTDIVPAPGDLVLARVDVIGQHKRIELQHGRRASLFEGDEIVVCYGNRYAPDQFEAEVPGNLEPCALIAAGGVAARMLSCHTKMSEPTTITPIGVLGDSTGAVLNLMRYAQPSHRLDSELPPIFGVAGTSMNAGKSTTAASLVRGFTACGLTVGAAKVTGTGAGGDIWMFTDAGACPVTDFTAAGHPSTYKLPPHEVVRTFKMLTDDLAAAGVDVMVIEVADGLLQDETAALLGSHDFAERVDGIVFAAGDAMGACNGVKWLRAEGLDVAGVSGLLTASPLARREAQAVLDVPVFDIQDLSDPVRAGALLNSHQRTRA